MAGVESVSGGGKIG